VSEQQQDQDQDPVAERLAALEEENRELQTRLQARALENARLEEQTKAAKPSEAEKPKPPTREQLQSAVDSGELTQSQMDEEMARQLRESLREEINREQEQIRSQENQRKTLQDEWNAYVDLRPDIKKEGSNEQGRVLAEVAELVKRGMPHDLRTEVVAMRNVYGTLDRVEETTRQRRESHKETGGSGSGEKRPESGAEWEKGLTSSQVAGFRKLIDKGVYEEDSDFFKNVVTRRRTKNVSEKEKAA